MNDPDNKDILHSNVLGNGSPKSPYLIVSNNFKIVINVSKPKITIQITKKYCTDVDSGEGGFRRVGCPKSPSADLHQLVTCTTTYNWRSTPE